MLNSKDLKMPFQSVRFGCDPEFFFEKDGKIIGSEKVLDLKNGLKVTLDHEIDKAHPKDNSKFIVDGVQAELNPRSATCRQTLRTEIARCFVTLSEHMTKIDPKIKINFMPTIKVSKGELDSLTESSKVFGCMPSKNIDKKSQDSVKRKDPAKYLYRSAGGHIHISPANETSPTDPVTAVLTQPERVIQIMDIIVGNTCVLIDRDPSNKERRKVYGKAGEFRTPIYGIEYRTLSNFWLRSYPLMSLVFGLSRLAVDIIASSIPGRDFEKELLSLVNPKAIRKAINTNDFKLAKENWDKIKPFLERILDVSGTPFTPKSLVWFEHFITKDMDYWFKDEPLTHWKSIWTGNNVPGWEQFLQILVKADYEADKAKETK